MCSVLITVSLAVAAVAARETKVIVKLPSVVNDHQVYCSRPLVAAKEGFVF